jgi:hypothetical protein
LPLERPRREPIIGADGKISPVWVRYFEELDTAQTVSDDYETEARFLGDATPVDAGVRQNRAAITATNTRVTALESDVREILFLGV